jgi:serralysin
MRRFLVPAAFVASFFVATQALAIPGGLDSTFSGDGKALTNVTPRLDFAIDVALQADGKIVAAGISGEDRRNPNLTVIRYASDGSLDSTFSSDGKVNTDFFGLKDAANDVVVQTDGKILASGLARTSRSNGRFAIVRYNDDGSLDTTFGGDGKVTTNFTPTSDSIQGVVVLGDGDIVAAGIAGYLGVNPKMALARYNPGGSLDTSFGGGDGKVMTDFTPTNDAAWAIALQLDTKIVVAGAAGDPNGKIALARFNANGTLDTTFGGDGRVTTNFSRKYDEALGVALQADGKILAVGGAGWGGANPKLAVARYLPNGSLDPSFNADGKVLTDFTSFADYANDVQVQGDGRIVVVGEARAERIDSTFALVRYNPGGSLDSSFGRVMTNVTSKSDNAIGVELQVDGKIVVAGSAAYGDGIDGKFVVARYDAI